MGLLDPGYGVDRLAGLEIKNQDSFIGLRSRKKPVALYIDLKMIEGSFNVGRQRNGLDQLERRGLLALNRCAQSDENRHQNENPFLHDSLPKRKFHILRDGFSRSFSLFAPAAQSAPPPARTA